MIHFTEEHQDIREMVSSFAQNELAPRAEHTDESAEYPRDSVAELAELGLLGAPIPEQFGGADGDALLSCLVIEELATGCAATALVVGAHALCVGRLLSEHGTDEQQQRLSDIASGRVLAGCDLLGSGSGSDLSLRAKASGDGWVLDGTCHGIVGAAPSSVYLVAAELDDGVGLFLVDGPEHEGVSVVGSKTVGVRGAGMSRVDFSACPVGASGRLPDAAVERFFNLEHALIASVAVGVARAAGAYAREYATQREAFGGPISRFDVLRGYFADAETSADAASLLVYRAACGEADGKSAIRAWAMARLFACQGAYQATKNAVQTLGGNGYSREYPVERMYRDAKTLEVVQPSIDSTRDQIAQLLLGETA